MIDIKSEQEKKARCLLVGLPVKDETSEKRPLELMGLVDTLGMETAETVTLNRIEPNPVYGIGKGKAEEIAERAKAIFADCIIFDFEIDPTKQRNWEKLTGINVFDRNEVIIRIFAQRAKTREASLQVELAKLQYSLPRLSHMYGDLARQRGGSYGAKGSGETQLELDRRQVEEKILRIKKELSVVQASRETQRKQRERTSVAECALVGYTNAGKSSLLNALTGADVLVEDKLFATLDPTTRKLPLSEASTVLLTDTVGFISNLPHTLIDAFRSTLEEASLANLLLIVVDASDAECEAQFAQVRKVLSEIKADKIEYTVVLNKIDRVQGDDLRMAFLDSTFPGAVKVSAKTGEGFEELLSLVTVKLLGEEHDYVVPMSESSLVEVVRKNGTLEKEEWLDDGIHITARISGQRTLSLLTPYKLPREG